jgi:hypothetical protein
LTELSRRSQISGGRSIGGGIHHAGDPELAASICVIHLSPGCHELDPVANPGNIIKDPICNRAS